MPSHHQSSFFEALRAEGIELTVCYYSQLDERRLSMGWGPVSLNSWEHFVRDIDELAAMLPNWFEYVHVVPGIAEKFTRTLIRCLIKNGVDWIHWSEGFRINYKKFHKILILRLYSRLIINKYALGLLANGDHAYRQFLSWGVKRHKLARLPYSTPRLNQASALSDTFTYLYLGSIESRKAIDCLITAFSRISDNHHTKLKIVGRTASGKNENPLSYYQNLCKELNVGDRVEFHPAISTADVSQVMSSAHVLVLPSRFDGWGVVVNEAVSLNKFVLVSDQVGAAETLIDNGVNGFVFNVDDVDAISVCLLAAYELLQQKRNECMVNTYDSVSPELNAKRLKMLIESFCTIKKQKVIFQT